MAASRELGTDGGKEQRRTAYFSKTFSVLEPADGFTFIHTDKEQPSVMCCMLKGPVNGGARTPLWGTEVYGLH